MKRDFGYGLCPLWSWNDRIEPDGIRSDLDWMSDVGFNGCFLHPRPGVRTKFVADEWLERAQDAINEANERGMDIWLYDEDSYPSGFAGGQLLEQYPEYRCRGLRYERAPTWEELPHDELRESSLSRVFALDRDEMAYELVDHEADAARYAAFWLEFAPDRARFNGHNYVDTRDPDAIDAFLEIVYEGYADALGDRFGDDVIGIFTDEPNGAHHLEEPALMWTANLQSRFHDAHGYDLLDHLPALICETEDAPAIRFDYYDLLNTLLVSNFTSRINEWCTEHDLLFTGHFWEHAWPNLSHTASIMPHYAEMSVPGIDCLFRPDAGRRQMSNVRMVRELDSVASQFDRRAMCEVWGGAGWSVTRTDLKRMADWLLVLGIDFFVPHFVHYSLEGARKRDWPPSYGEHFSGTTALEPLFESIAETASWLDTGDRRPSTAVLHPSTTMWTEWTPDVGGDIPAGHSFETFVADLERSGVEFDLLDETILETYGNPGEAGLTVGTSTYETVVITEDVTNVTAATRDALATASVDVLFMDGADVKHVDGRPPDVPLDELWTTTRLGGDEIHDRLRTASPVTHDAPGTLYCRATFTGDEWRCFVVNPTDEHIEDVTVRAPIDTETVSVTDRFQSKSWAPSNTSDEKRSSSTATVDLSPFQSLCLTFGGTDEVSATRSSLSSSSDAPDALVPSDIDIERDGPNVAVLDFCDLTLEGDVHDDAYVLEAQDTIFESHDLDYRSQPFELRHWWRLVRDGHKRRRGPGFEASFRFTLEERPESRVRAVVENGELFDVTINGHPVSVDDGTWLDDAFHCADVTQYLVQGANELAVSAERISIEHPLEACYLLGEFVVDIDDPTQPRLHPTDENSLEVGSITDQGHPFYVGWVTYTGTITYDTEWGGYSLDVGDFDGLAVTATVNGTSVGPVGDPCTDDDVTSLLVDGENTIALSVYVSPGNVLGPLHHESTPRETGLAHPGMFTPHGSESFQTSHRIDHAGLYEPFRLIPNRN